MPMTAFEQGLRADREGAGRIREPEQQPVLHHSQNVFGGRKDSRSNWSGLLFYCCISEYDLAFRARECL